MPRDFLASHGLDEHGTRMNVIVPRIEWGATAMYNYRPLIPDLPAILEKSATTIQKAWQNHQIMKKEQLDRELYDFMYCRRAFNKWEWDSDGFHDDHAKVIQRVWRGHRLRKLLEGAGRGTGVLGLGKTAGTLLSVAHDRLLSRVNLDLFTQRYS
tara:strand:+ start:49 stop:513 length:465 start_codon:yes stop_codon:yes gene_type:complete